MRLIYPLEFFEGTTNAKDPLLWDAVKKYNESQFGEGYSYPFWKDIKTWVEAEHGEEGYEISGITSIRFMVDCHVFHVTPPGDDEKAREAARETRNKLAARAMQFVQDNLGLGTRALVYVNPSVERFWKGFLRLIQAKPAGRWELRL